jgi:hypothetical protein
VADLSDLARISRLLSVLLAEISQRKEDRRAEPTVLFFIDNYGALRQTLSDDPVYERLTNDIESIVRDGPAFGIQTIITAKNERAIPVSLSGLIQARLYFHLADPNSYSALGVRPADVPNLPPGRCLVATDGGTKELQLVLVSPEQLDALPITCQSGEGRGAPQVPEVPANPTDEDLDNARMFDVDHDAPTDVNTWPVPVGLHLTTGRAAYLRLRFGEHSLIIGPPRSGRSSLASAIVQHVFFQNPGIPIAIIATRAGPLSDQIPGTHLISDPADIDQFVGIALSSQGPRLLVIDDADRLSGVALEQLANHKDDQLVTLSVVRGDALRTFGFWGKNLASSRNGIITRPVPGDGELLRTVLPTRIPRIGQNTAALVDDGDAHIIQLVAR